MAQQFENVSAKHGAPMGRRHTGSGMIAILPASSIRLFRVKLDSGGYDDGGAYWGIESVGKLLYCAQALEYIEGEDVHLQLFVRAKDRKEAAELLEIPDYKLKRTTLKPCVINLVIQS